MKSSTRGNQTKAFVLAVLLSAGFINPGSFSLVHAETIGCEKGFKEEFNEPYLDTNSFKVYTVGGLEDSYIQNVVNGGFHLFHKATNSVIGSYVETKDRFSGKFAVQTSIDFTEAADNSTSSLSIGRGSEDNANYLAVYVKKSGGGYEISVGSMVNGQTSVSQITPYQTTGQGNSTTLFIERNADVYSISHLSGGVFKKSHDIVGGFRGDAKVSVGYVTQEQTTDSYLRINKIQIDCSQLPVTPGENLSSLRQTIKSEITRKLNRIEAYKKEVREKYRGNVITDAQRDLILSQFSGHITALEGLKEEVGTLTSATLLQEKSTKVFSEHPIARWEKIQTQRRRLYSAINLRNSFAEEVKAKKAEFDTYAVPTSTQEEYPLYTQTVSTFTSVNGTLDTIQSSYDQGMATLDNLTLSKVAVDAEAFQTAIRSINNRMTFIKQTAKQADVHLKTIRQNMNKMKYLSLGTPEG